MTAEDRERIRQAVDQQVRERRGLLIAAGELEVCCACGCDLDCYTAGCKRCWDRHQRRDRWRRDAEYRAKQNASRKARHRRRKAAAGGPV